MKFIADISAALYARHGTHFINICTDGDSTRRQVMNNIMQHEIPFFCPIYSYVKDLPFVDTKLGKNLETVNFDAKHLAKRCWCTMLKDKVELDGLLITKKSLESLLGDAHKIFPQDKQNVPSATKFLILLHEKVNEGEVPYHLLPIKKHLYMLSEVFKGILSLYAFVHQSLSQLS